MSISSFFLVLFFVHQSDSQFLGNESTGEVGFKGTEREKTVAGCCAVAVPVSSPCSEGGAAHVSWLSKGWGALWEKGERLKRRGFLSGLGRGMSGWSSGRQAEFNPMTLSHFHGPADCTYSSSSPSAGCIAARLCLDGEKMRYRE